MMTDLPQRGDRIRLVSTSDRYTRLVPGAEGIVNSVNRYQVGIAWDDGSSLSLLPDEDRWEVLS